MIFVTGGTGFLGKHLIASLCRRDFPLRVLTRTPDRHTWLEKYPKLEIISGDIRDRQLIADCVKGCQYVIHAGGKFSFWGDDCEFEDVNVTGAKNVMDACRDEQVERVIHVSTVILIGTPDNDGIVDENHPVNPQDPYQRSKWHAEQLVRSYHTKYDVPVIILRPGAFYGPLGTYAFNRLFFRDALRGLMVQLDGGNYITFPVYIGDAVQSIHLALERGRIGEIYNIAGEWMTHNEVFAVIKELTGIWYPKIPISRQVVIPFARLLTLLSKVTHREPFYPINLRSVIFNNWRVSSDKARRELGFVPTDFRVGAKRTLEWYQAGMPDVIDEMSCP